MSKQPRIPGTTAPNPKPKKHVRHTRRPPGPDLLNIERAVFVAGPINGEMVASLTPRIIALKRASTDPINVFIDSPGGDPRGMQVILGLLKTPDERARSRYINTIVTGHACSAAADLLAEGDYIAAYRHAYIHFHGVRLCPSDFSERDALTAEAAREIQNQLLIDNKSSSVELAAAAFDRHLDNYSRLLPQIKSTRSAKPGELQAFDAVLGKGMIDLPAYAFALSDELKEPYDGMVLYCLDLTARRAAILGNLRKPSNAQHYLPPALQAAITKKNQDPKAARSLSRQIAFLNALLADCITNESDWELSAETFSNLEQRFLQLREVEKGAFARELDERVAKSGPLVMSPKERKFFQDHTWRETDDPKIGAESTRIINTNAKRLEPLWSFTLTLCDLLNVGENPMQPSDAFWLGLIDEVVGTPLARREISESIRESLLTHMPVAESQSFYR